MPYYYYGYNFSYMIILLPALLFALYAQFKVNSTVRKYSEVRNTRGLTGAEVARRILDHNGLYNIQVVHIAGNMTDNYNPKTGVVSLSDTTYASTSVAAIGIAAHECGHAVQYAQDYTPIRIRSMLVPVTNVGSTFGFIVLAVGMIFGNYYIAMFGVLLYCLMAVFQAVTLPVEFNASSRALHTLESEAILTENELPMARKVLSAAAMTYVASLVSTLATILRLLLIVGGRGSRRR
ncbi:MAG: zinc metallopeptidase [Oscillospiraceae bacterium]|nr:zinc metallopeptidase [Oscillospiraceae bacterium]